MVEEPGVSRLALAPLAEAVARLGGSSADFLRGLGLDATSPNDAYVPGSTVARVLDATGKALGLQNLGLSLALASPVGTLGMLDFAFLMCPNLRAVLERLTMAQAILSQRYAVAFDEREGVARFGYRTSPPAVPIPALAELYLALVVSRAAEGIGRPLPLRAVRFSHSVDNPSQHHLLFATKVAFQQELDEIELDAALLDIPFRTSDPTGIRLLDEYMVPMARRGSGIDPVVAAMQTAIESRLATKDLSLGRLAKDMSMSARTLQRKLKEKGLSHRELVDAVRREAAIRLLGQDGISATEVADRLGFADPASFSRAFVRWTGTTPGVFRDSKRAR